MQLSEASLEDLAASLPRGHTFDFIHLVTLGVGVAQCLRGQMSLSFLIYQ